MKTLQIKIPKGFEVDTFNKEAGEMKFKESPKDIKELLDNFNDVLEYHGITQKKFNKNNNGLSPDEIGYRKEKLIVAAYNQGQLPDWEDGTTKYIPYFKMGPSGFRYDVYAFWHSGSAVGSRLCFVGDNAKENMLDATSKFLSEYKESRTL